MSTAERPLEYFWREWRPLLLSGVLAAEEALAEAARLLLVISLAEHLSSDDAGHLETAFGS